MCDFRPMDPETERYINWIRAGLRPKGKTQTGLAERLGVEHPQVSKMMKGERKISVHELPKIAEYLEMPPPARQIPLVGKVGAGGSIVYTNEFSGGETIEGPWDAAPESVAVEITGESLGAFEGWIAIYSRRFEPFHEALYNKLCVVGTTDGRTLIKWIRRSDTGVGLASGTGAIEDGVMLEWAAPVTNLRPKS